MVAGAGRAGRIERRPVLPDHGHRQVYGTRIEVLDPDSGSLVTTFDTSELLLHFVGPQLVAAYREDDGGMPRVVILRLRLREPERR